MPREFWYVAKLQGLLVQEEPSSVPSVSIKGAVAA